MKRPPELLKSFANHVAELAGTEESSYMLRLLQLTGLLQEASAQCGHGSGQADEASAEAPIATNRVGIWERKSEGEKTYFVRSMQKANEWNMWANVGRIAAKGARRRVILIGESVARGYLYDPLFTPAKVLEKVFQAHLGRDELEVVDLARVNLMPQALLEVAESSLVLEPDAVVILAGNNWGLGFGTDLEDPDDLRCVAAVSRNRGVAGLKQFAEEHLQLKARQLVDRIASRCAAKGVPLVWVVPEFNLKDWRDPEMNAPYLDHDANREWIILWGQARSAFESGDIAGASDRAARMVALDGGVAVAGFYILADCCLHSADLEGARRYLEQARDSLIWDNSGYVPARSYSIVQDTLRQEAIRHGNGLVDLPLVFAEHLRGELPDRRLFVDHCHLTSEGIRVAMAAAGACLLRLFRDEPISWRELTDERIAPPAEVEAEAAFLAAVRNAHWWQAPELVEAFCLRAVEYSPKAARLMVSFGELQTYRAPMLMSRPAAEFSEGGTGLTQFYTVQYGKQLIDNVLLGAFETSLRKLGIGGLERLERLRREQHSVAVKDSDLLDYYYCSASRQPYELMWSFVKQGRSPLLMTRSDYYKAYGRESRFVFVAESDCLVWLSLTCRIPKGGPAESAIEIRINNQSLGTIVIGRQWESLRIFVGSQELRDGLNEVTIRWPLPEFPNEDEFRALLAHQVDQGIYPDFYPVFGEIHSFLASDERRMQASDLREADEIVEAACPNVLKTGSRSLSEWLGK